MTQQVNLFQASLSWQDNALPAALVLRLVAATAVVLLALYSFTWFQSRGVMKAANGQAERIAELQVQMAEFAERAAHRVEDKALSSRVVALREQLEAKQRLLEALSTRGQGNEDGFSAHLGGLARETVDGVWLREIRISKGGAGLSLVGSALSADAVPVFLEQLGKEPAFSGRQFQTFRLDLSGERPGSIDFVIATDLEAKK